MEGEQAADDAASPTMEEQAADLGSWLSESYGDSTEMEYIDVFSQRMDDFPLAHRAIFMMNVSLPVIAFDGQPRIAGGISLEMIGEELEKRGLGAAE